MNNGEKTMIKLIATDIDGTLVKDGTLDINPEYMTVIKKLALLWPAQADSSAVNSSYLHR